MTQILKNYQCFKDNFICEVKKCVQGYDLAILGQNTQHLVHKGATWHRKATTPPSKLWAKFESLFLSSNS